MKTAIYARVSTEEQGRYGYGIDTQLRLCREQVISRNLPTAQEYVDKGFSGEFIERPALEKLRNDLRAKLIKNVVVYDPDRLSRNLTHMLLLADEIDVSGADLFFCTGDYDVSPEGKLFFSIRGAVAAFEKEKTRERTMRGRKSKALAGKVIIGHPKYGYDWNKEVSNYTINEAERKIVKEIYEMCFMNYGLHRIKNALIERGLLNKRGRPFKIKYIYTILTDPFYTGTYYHYREQWRKTSQNKYDVTKMPPESWLGIPVPAIVTVEEQTRAKKQMAANQINAKRNRNFDYMLTGMIKCGICGHGMTAISLYRNKKYLKYYICYGKRVLKICPDSAYVPVDEIESAVWEGITKIAEGKDTLQPKKSFTLDKSKEINDLLTRQQSILKTKDSITSLIFEGLIDTDKARKRLQQIQRELAEIASAIAELEAIQKKVEFKLPVITVSDVLNAKTISEKHDKLKQWGLQVTVFKKKREETAFYLGLK